MKYPSELLHDAADRLDALEDVVVEKAYAAECYAKSWKIWEWRRQQEKLESLRVRHEGLLKDYRELQKLYREKTGQEPPFSRWAALKDLDAVLEALKETWWALGRR